MNVEVPREKIAEFCRKWRVSELALFGSVLRDDFRPDSDVDVLLTFEPDAGISLFDYVDIEDELAEILGRRVDLVSRSVVESSNNPFRRRGILGSAHTVYPSGHSREESRLRETGVLPPDRDPGLLFDMRANASLAREFVADMDAEGFARDETRVAATSRVLGVMGRVAGKVSPGVRKRNPGIDWAGMAGFADRLIEEYRDVSPEEVWSAAREAADAIPRIEPLIPLIEEESDATT